MLPERKVDSEGYVAPVYPREVWANSRVYFIRAIGTDLVKVGFSDDVGRRLKELQTASPHELKLERVIVGTPAIEAEVHRRLKFHGCHVRGEWYRLANEDAVQWIIVDLFEDGLVPS